MKKFKIPITPLTTNKCIRFPNTIIKSVETAIQEKDYTFTAFVIETVKITLGNSKDD